MSAWHHADTDVPKKHQHVLLLCKVNYSVNYRSGEQEHFTHYYMLEGFYSTNYDSGKPEWYDSTGDVLDDYHEVMAWMELPQLPDWVKEK